MIAATEKVTKCEETQIGGNTQMSEEAAIPAIEPIAGPSGAKENAPTRTLERRWKDTSSTCCSLREIKNRRSQKLYSIFTFEFQLTTLPLLN